MIIIPGTVSDKCRKCGAKVSPGYNFCLSCGTKFSELPPTTRVRESGGDQLIGAGADLAMAASCLPCFIATAAYGSHLSPQVRFLRHIRDKRLKQSRLGNLFVNRFEWV